MTEVYQKSVEEIVEEFETNLEQGLSSEEVKNREEEYGLNELEEQETKTWYEILLENLNNIIVYLLGGQEKIKKTFVGQKSSESS